MASCNSENSATVYSNNVRIVNLTSLGFNDVQTELKIASAANAGDVSLETRYIRILTHS